jgi:hypothetical protein
MPRRGPRKTQLKLRNDIARCLNNWPLGCRVQSGDSMVLNRYKNERLRNYKFEMLVFGVSKAGLAILIYPMKTRLKVPRQVALLLEEFHGRGALAGCAQNIDDAWDIVSNSPDYKRKARTYHFLKVLEHLKRNKEISDESE